jgi:hypothetical protein
MPTRISFDLPSSVAWTAQRGDETAAALIRVQGEIAWI